MLYSFSLFPFSSYLYVDRLLVSYIDRFSRSSMLTWYRRHGYYDLASSLNLTINMYLHFLLFGHSLFFVDFLYIWLPLGFSSNLGMILHISVFLLITLTLLCRFLQISFSRGCQLFFYMIYMVFGFSSRRSIF